MSGHHPGGLPGLGEQDSKQQTANLRILPEMRSKCLPLQPQI